MITAAAACAGTELSSCEGTIILDFQGCYWHFPTDALFYDHSFVCLKGSSPCEDTQTRPEIKVHWHLPPHWPFKLGDEQHCAGDAQGHERQRVDNRLHKGQPGGDAWQNADDHFEPWPALGGRVRDRQMPHSMKDSEHNTRQPEAKGQPRQLRDRRRRSKDMWRRLFWCQLSAARPIIKLQWTHHMTAGASADRINKWVNAEVAGQAKTTVKQKTDAEDLRSDWLQIIDSA